MSCDLADASALAQRLDPEDLRSVVRAFQESASTVIERWEGHVAQYLVDGLLAYFCYPQAHEDDAERAVRAGLEILSALQASNDAIEREHGIRLAARVGIHTGPVVIGEMGGGASSAMIALGDVPHMAARVQRAAEPDSVVITRATRRLVAGTFVIEDRGTHVREGGHEPLALHRVVSPSGVRGRIATAAGRLTPSASPSRPRRSPRWSRATTTRQDSPCRRSRTIAAPASARRSGRRTRRRSATCGAREAAHTRARELASRIGNAPELARVLVGLGTAYFVKGDLATGEAVGHEALAAAERTADALDLLLAHVVAVGIGASGFLTLFADRLCRVGRFDDASMYVGLGLVRAEGQGAHWVDAELHRLHAQIVVDRGGAEDEAEARFSRSPSRSRGGTRTGCTGCGLPWASHGSGNGRAGAPTRAACSRRPTADSPTASTCAIRRTPRRCWPSWADATRDASRALGRSARSGLCRRRSAAPSVEHRKHLITSLIENVGEGRRARRAHRAFRRSVLQRISRSLRCSQQVAQPPMPAQLHALDQREIGPFDGALEWPAHPWGRCGPARIQGLAAKEVAPRGCESGAVGALIQGARGAEEPRVGRDGPAPGIDERRRHADIDPVPGAGAQVDRGLDVDQVLTGVGGVRHDPRVAGHDRHGLAGGPVGDRHRARGQLVGHRRAPRPPVRHRVGEHGGDPRDRAASPAGGARLVGAHPAGGGQVVLAGRRVGDRHRGRGFEAL
ncbi:MAG: adenylate/guanylate cyclase domain-containing protein [bacterium]|nr:adenylate/guanylate cyclase domain-containing protein [bacterium]